MSLKVLVANLPGLKEEAGGQLRHFVKAGSRWPFTVGFQREIEYLPYPFFLGYTSALLKRDSEASVKGLDGVVEHMTETEFLRRVKGESPDVIITEVPILTMRDDLRLLAKVKEEFGSRIVVCGPQATAMAGEILSKNLCVDYVMIGEYELTALELVNKIIKGSENDLGTIRGLAWRKNGTVVTNERRPLLGDLDFLPFPDRDDFPGDKYRDFAFYLPCIQMYSSRGCPFNCVFCAERQVFYKEPLYRVREPRKIADEMELAKEKFNARQIYFDDMTFTVKRDHVIGICKEIARRKLDIPWTCMGDAMAVTLDELEAMKRAGCIGMKFGVESATPEILKNIRKPIDLSRVRKVVEWLRRVDIRSHATYCIGLPGENVNTVNETIRFALSLGSDSCQLSIATPYPGTPFFDWCDEQGYLATKDFSQYDGTQNAVISYPNLSKETIERLYSLACHRLFETKGKRELSWYVKNPGATARRIISKYRRSGFRGSLGSLVSRLKKSI